MNRRSTTRHRLARASQALAIALAVGAAIEIAGSSQARAGAPVMREFVRRITNPYLPLRPGAVWVYRGTKDGVGQIDTVRVLRRTRSIAGVRATSVSDIARHGSRILEQTTDWYAQDRRGDVWYLGEATKAFGPNGTVDTSGSWLAGVHGAKAGIVMTAHPRVGDAHRQEYWAGHAEDQYWLVALHDHVSVPFVSTQNALRTFEWSRLEPGVIDQKDYVRGIGVVEELAAKGPREVAKLVRYRR
jgi:hypothetical protein